MKNAYSEICTKKSTQSVLICRNISLDIKKLGENFSTIPFEVIIESIKTFNHEKLDILNIQTERKSHETLEQKISEPMETFSFRNALKR